MDILAINDIIIYKLSRISMCCFHPNPEYKILFLYMRYVEKKKYAIPETTHALTCFPICSLSFTLDTIFGFS